MGTNELYKKLVEALQKQFPVVSLRIYNLTEDSFEYQLSNERDSSDFWHVNFTNDQSGLVVDFKDAKIVRPPSFNNGPGDATLSMGGE